MLFFHLNTIFSRVYLFPKALGTDKVLNFPSLWLHVNTRFLVGELGEANLIVRCKYHWKATWIIGLQSQIERIKTMDYFPK